jgi:hypothetical protein
MQENGIGRLVVMTDPGFGRDPEFVGLLSRSDLMTALDIIRSSGALDGSRDRLAPTAADGEPRIGEND